MGLSLLFDFKLDYPSQYPAIEVQALNDHSIGSGLIRSVKIKISNTLFIRYYPRFPMYCRSKVRLELAIRIRFIDRFVEFLGQGNSSWRNRKDPRWLIGRTTCIPACFGGDNDQTIATVATIDGSVINVPEDLDALYVDRVDAG